MDEPTSKRTSTHYDDGSARSLHYIGNALRIRFENHGELAFLDYAIMILATSVSITPMIHPCRPSRLYELGYALDIRFRTSGNLGDNQEAIATFGHAADLTPDGHGLKPMRLQGLSKALYDRFRYTGDLDSLKRSLVTIQRVLELTAEGSSEMPMRLKDFRAVLRNCLHRIGGYSEIERYIAAEAPASNPSLDGQLQRAALLHGFGLSLLLCFRRWGELDYLEHSIEVIERGLELIPDENPLKGGRLHVLAAALRDRFGCVGEIGDLERSIAAMQQALELTPEEHAEKDWHLHAFGVSLRDRFQCTGELDDLEQSITVLREAILLTPEGHTEMASRLQSLTASLSDRLRLSGELDDLDECIVVTRRLVGLTPKGHPEQAQRLQNLGMFLRERSQHTGQLEDLQQSIVAAEQAVELTPDGQFPKAERLHRLAVSLNDRFRHLGDVDDLKQSVTLIRHAIELTPDGSSDMAARQQDLASFLNDRYRNIGEVNYLEQSIAATQCALELTPEGRPERAEQLLNLGVGLLDRFKRLGELEDLERSVLSVRRAVELTPERHLERASRLWIMSASLRDRYQHTGELDDIEEAVAAIQEAMDLTPEGHPDMSGRLLALATALHDRFRNLGDLGDLEKAIAANKRAVRLTPEGLPALAARLHGFGICLRTRFEHLGEFDDLNQSIAALQRAVRLTPKGHSDGVPHLLALGHTLVMRLEREPNLANFEGATATFIIAAMNAAGDPSKRWEAAQTSVQLLVDDGGRFGSPEWLLFAHSHAMNVLPEIVWLGHSIGRRYEECAKHSSAVSAAVCAAIRNQAPSQAIEWLEAGRTFIWSQLLSLRTPVEELQAKDHDLAESLVKVSDSLRRSESSAYRLSASTSSPDTTHANAAAEQHRQLVLQYEQILLNIRARRGFEDFMRPLKLDGLLSALECTEGPVVFINVDSSSCDAMVISLDGSIVHVPLPQLTEKRAHQLRALWMQNLQRSHVRMRRGAVPEDSVMYGSQSMFARILGRLWTWVVQPILERLNLLIKDSGSLSHITWCPTGPLTQLPLHAAGIYDTIEGYRPHTYDFVVSSYTPSLSVLLQNRRSSPDGRVTAQPSLLMIAQPQTPGLTPLPGTAKECARVRSALPDAISILLQHDEAVVAHTLDVLGQHPWVHLACHGKQDTVDPTQSAFALYDGPLTLSALMKTIAENAELAFLSACQTAVGDEKIPEESAHLAAGMLVVGFRGVVATMWSIGDEDAPIVAEAYYKKLVELRSSGTAGHGTGAAYALHEAVKVLREKVGEQSIVKWAPFVHFGI